MLIFYEWGHGPGVTIGNNAECTVCRAGKGIEGESNRKKERKRKEDRRKSWLHQPLHSVRHRDARLLRHLWHSLDLTKFIRIFDQLPQYLVALLGRGGREVVIADGDDAGYGRDYLCEFSLGDGVGVGAQTPDRMLWMA